MSPCASCVHHVEPPGDAPLVCKHPESAGQGPGWMRVKGPCGPEGKLHEFRFCFLCAYCGPEFAGASQCLHPSLRGKGHFNADAMYKGNCRNNENLCGPAGRWWTPAPQTWWQHVKAWWRS